jgi:hypothetical protein
LLGFTAPVLIFRKNSTFTPRMDKSMRPVTTDDLEKDQVLEQRIILFSWIRLEHLDLPSEEGSQGFLSFAQKGD